MVRRLYRIGSLTIIALFTLFALAPIAAAAPTLQASGSVEAADQAIVDGAITVASVTAGQDGWIVAHLDEGGKPGKVIGHTAVPQGENKDVKIQLDEAVPVGGKIWPMLHVDAGSIGTYEFPGADAPVVVDGNVVMKQISITAAAAVPNALPRTGGDNSPTGIWISALVLLMAGMLIFVRMRRQA